MLLNAFPGFDCHIHSRFSDGCDSLEAMARAAAARGLAGVVFTDHMPLPFETRYALGRRRLEAYRAEIQAVRRRMSGRLQVLMGLEMEVLPSHTGWSREIAKRPWDVLIASVHQVEHAGRRFLVNGTEAEFVQALETGFGGDIRRLCSAYYRQSVAMATTGWCRILGHLDVLGKHNRNGRFFDETAPWYRDLVAELLAAVERAGMVVEINTGGLDHPAGSTYPGDRILAAIAAKGIPVCLSSDAHRPEEVARHFDRIQTVPQQVV
ncbi:MAG: histidinol-phosphatase [Desulfobacterales bacterium]